MRPLNLASRPFRNERLPFLLLAGAGVVLIALTLWHAVLVARVLPGSTSALRDEVAGLQRQANALRQEGRSLQRARPAGADLAQWALLKDLVDRRAFSWTSLFAVLEEVLPDGVRLRAITPRQEKGRVQLDMAAVARSYEDGLDFIRVLEERPEFEEVLPVSRADEDAGGGEGVAFNYRMTYEPSAAPPPAAAPSPTPPPEEEPAEAADEVASREARR
ncbi:MAG TPA: PilN domain-containing protein [Vicinamibacteria bacterium]